MRNSRGFTLIELMITVAIIAILAAIALPAYGDYIRRGKITEALSALAGMRVKMEQHFQDNREYSGACLPGSVAPVPVTPNFDYPCVTSATTVVPSTYTITATGKVGSTMSDFGYSLNEANVQITTGLPPSWAGLNKRCWVIKSDGSC